MRKCKNYGCKFLNEEGLCVLVTIDEMCDCCPSEYMREGIFSRINKKGDVKWMKK
jgi:hypothetical protein